MDSEMKNTQDHEKKPISEIGQRQNQQNAAKPGQPPAPEAGKKPVNRLVQLVKFSLGTLIGYLGEFSMFTFLNEVLGLYYVVSKLVGYALGVTISFLINSRHAFHASFKNRENQYRFVILSCVSLSLSTVVLYLLRTMAHWNTYVAFFLSSGCSFLTNYLGNRFWVYNHKTAHTDSPIKTK